MKLFSMAAVLIPLASIHAAGPHPRGFSLPPSPSGYGGPAEASRRRVG